MPWKHDRKGTDIHAWQQDPVQVFHTHSGAALHRQEVQNKPLPNKSISNTTKLSWRILIAICSLHGTEWVKRSSSSPCSAVSVRGKSKNHLRQRFVTGVESTECISDWTCSPQHVSETRKTRGIEAALYINYCKVPLGQQQFPDNSG